ncbi:MAG TPA: PadR family transcriptional regulator [Streptosporangiaceae bacterium]|nr:PadR family transcriptional regulator [Streptosporangiaceae bacterium]
MRSRHRGPFGGFDFGGAWSGGFGPFGPGPGGQWGAGPRGRHGPWGRQGPWGRGPKAKRGDVRAAILALLAEEPRNGYQIIQEIDERSGGSWRPSPGAVYPALQQLADEGMIRGEEGDGKKTFRLTPEGEAYVAEHADELRAPWEAMRADFPGNVGELLRQAAQTGAAVMQVVHTGSDAQVAAAQQALADTRRRLYTILSDDDPDAAGEGDES